MKDIYSLLPKNIQIELQALTHLQKSALEEIRIRLGRPVECVFATHHIHLEKSLVSKNDCQYILNQISEFSLYRLETELKQGYITIPGGHRVGISGSVNMKGTELERISHITFLNIRIAKQVYGSATSLVSHIFRKTYDSTLIVGPPKSGKTTLLRDLCRILGTGWGKRAAIKVGLIDERSEIAASIDGIPQNDIGIRTDVLDGCPKELGMMMFIRSMSPDVLIVDEIGSYRDLQAITEALHAGVKVICTVHGESLEQVQQRPSFKDFLLQELFEYVVVLNSKARTNRSLKLYTRDQERKTFTERDIHCQTNRKSPDC